MLPIALHPYIKSQSTNIICRVISRKGAELHIKLSPHSFLFLPCQSPVAIIPPPFKTPYKSEHISYFLSVKTLCVFFYHLKCSRILPTCTTNTSQACLLYAPAFCKNKRTAHRTEALLLFSTWGLFYDSGCPKFMIPLYHISSGQSGQL